MQSETCKRRNPVSKGVSLRRAEGSGVARKESRMVKGRHTPYAQSLGDDSGAKQRLRPCTRRPARHSGDREITLLEAALDPRCR